MRKTEHHRSVVAATEHARSCIVPVCTAKGANDYAYDRVESFTACSLSASEASAAVISAADSAQPACGRHRQRHWQSQSGHGAFAPRCGIGAKRPRAPSRHANVRSSSISSIVYCCCAHVRACCTCVYTTFVDPPAPSEPHLVACAAFRSATAFLSATTCACRLASTSAGASTETSPVASAVKV